MNMYDIKDYATAKSYEDAKFKNLDADADRPSSIWLYNSIKMYRDNDVFFNAPIVLALDNRRTRTPIIKYYDDGSTWVNLHGEGHTKEMQAIVNAHTDIEIAGSKGFVKLLDSSRTTIAGKDSKCRTCHGAGDFETQCYPGWCEHRDWNTLCSIHNQKGYHATACAHGSMVDHSHPDVRRTCHRCDGTGKVNYGDKVKGMKWDDTIPFFIKGNTVLGEKR